MLQIIWNRYARTTFYNVSTGSWMAACCGPRTSEIWTAQSPSRRTVSCNGLCCTSICCNSIATTIYTCTMAPMPLQLLRFDSLLLHIIPVNFGMIVPSSIFCCMWHKHRMLSIFYRQSLLSCRPAQIRTPCYWQQGILYSGDDLTVPQYGKVISVKLLCLIYMLKQISRWLT